MNKRDKKAVAVALAALTLWTAWGLATVSRKAEEYARRVGTVETVRETETLAKIKYPIELETQRTVEPDTAEPVVETEPQDLGTFKLTAYCSCPQCCGEWSDGITYTGTVATAGRTVAVDPRVIPLGSTVNINGQAYIAEDIGGAIKGNRIDVFFSSHTDALEFGVQYSTVSIEI